MYFLESPHGALQLLCLHDLQIPSGTKLKKNPSKLVENMPKKARNLEIFQVFSPSCDDFDHNFKPMPFLLIGQFYKFVGLAKTFPTSFEPSQLNVWLGNYGLAPFKTLIPNFFDYFSILDPMVMKLHG